MSSVNGNENLTPDKQLLKYGEALKNLLSASGEDSEFNTIFAQQFVGNPQKHPSLHLAHQQRERYGQNNPAPPVTDLIGRVHTIFKAGATKLPKLDIEALDESTQRSIEEFKNVLAEYQKLVAATADKNVPPDYLKILSSDRDKITNKAEEVLEALSTCELVTSLTIPVIVTSDQGVAEHIRVENKDELGLFLFALPHISQNLINLNRVPIEFRNFLKDITDVTLTIVEKEVDKVHSHPSLKAQAVATFTSMNAQLHDVFLAHERTLQLAALVSPDQRHEYTFILENLGFEAHLKRLENTLEAAVVLEAISENYPSKSLDELVRQFSHHIKDNAPPADLLNKTQTALSEVAGRNDLTREMHALLQDYVTRQIAVTTAVSVPGRPRQDNNAIG